MYIFICGSNDILLFECAIDVNKYMYSRAKLLPGYVSCIHAFHKLDNALLRPPVTHYLAEGLDMILMPGLAFTTTGHRMGRGGGFYDRYLSEYRGRHGRLPVLKAIAFKEQICDAVPVDDTDVDIDHVVYER